MKRILIEDNPPLLYADETEYVRKLFPHEQSLDDAILKHTEIDVKRWRKLDEVPFDFERRRVSVRLNG